jgi:hypothetical protein
MDPCSDCGCYYWYLPAVVRVWKGVLMDGGGGQITTRGYPSLPLLLIPIPNSPTDPSCGISLIAFPNTNSLAHTPHSTEPSTPKTTSSSSKPPRSSLSSSVPMLAPTPTLLTHRTFLVCRRRSRPTSSSRSCRRLRASSRVAKARDQTTTTRGTLLCSAWRHSYPNRKQGQRCGVLEGSSLGALYPYYLESWPTDSVTHED